MSFMEAQMTEKQTWLRVETDAYCWFIPEDVVSLTQEEVDAINEKLNGPPTDEGDGDEIPAPLRDYVGGKKLTAEIELIEGWGVRSSAPGYLDCTEWDVYTEEEEAEEAFKEEQRECRRGDDNEEDEDRDDEPEDDEEEEDDE